MPPKKRGRPASTATSDPVGDDNVTASEDLIAPPPKKRGRPPKPKPAATDAEAVNEDDSAPPPAKKARGRPKKTPAVVVELSDDEPAPPKPIEDDVPAVVPVKKANGKQIAEDEDDEQDMKPSMLYQPPFFYNSLDTPLVLKIMVIVPSNGATNHRDVINCHANHYYLRYAQDKSGGSLPETDQETAK